MIASHKSTEAAIAADPHNGDPWVSLNAAAELSGRSRLAVLSAVIDGKVRHQRVAGRRVFHRDDLAALRNSSSPNDEED